MPAPITISCPTYAFPMLPDEVDQLITEEPDVLELVPDLDGVTPGSTVRVPDPVADAVFDRYTAMLRRSHHVPIPDQD